MAEIKVNGIPAGMLLFEQEMDISAWVKNDENSIEVRYFISKRNLLGPYHFSGSRYPGATPWMFELNNTWDEDKSPYYHDYFDLKKFHEDKNSKIV